MLPLLALLAGAVALGSSPILVRLSELEPTATAFYRVALAAPAFLLFAFPCRKPLSFSRNSRAGWIGLLWLVAAGGFFAVDFFCLHWSLRHTSVVNATLFLNFAPIFVSLGAWVAFRELPAPRTLLSHIIAVCGVALLVGGVPTFEPAKLFGDVLGLAAGAAYGAYLLVASRSRYGMPTSLVMGMTTLSCACLLLPATLAMGESLVPRTATAWATLLALALITHAGGQGLLVFALKYFPLYIVGDIAAAAGRGGMRCLDHIQRDAWHVADLWWGYCAVWDSSLPRCGHSRRCRHSRPTQEFARAQVSIALIRPVWA
jgi:drug/metabolite transporter (DMT)-like permease